MTDEEAIAPDGDVRGLADAQPPLEVVLSRVDREAP